MTHEAAVIAAFPSSHKAEITRRSVGRCAMTLIMALHGWMAICVSMAQQPGTTKTEGNPTISVKECTSNGCSTKDHKLVLDANWRWIHTEDSKNCYEGNMWDTSICADATTCAEKCQQDKPWMTSTNSSSSRTGSGGQVDSSTSGMWQVPCISWRWLPMVVRIWAKMQLELL